MKVLNLDVKKIVVQQISINRTRMVLTTTNDNEYSVYRDTHNNTCNVYANWKPGHLEGKDKADMLELMKKYINR